MIGPQLVALAMLFRCVVGPDLAMWLSLVNVELKQNEVTDDGIGTQHKELQQCGRETFKCQGAPPWDRAHCILLHHWSNVA